MEFMADVVFWLADASHWQGPRGVPTRIVEHLAVSAVPLGVAVSAALPLGIVIGHTGRGAAVAINAANIGRALPSLAIIVGILPFALRAGLGLGFWPTVVALTVLALPPIVTNTYAGLRGVDREFVDAARGMGMDAWQVITRVELPLAAPVVLTGIRIAAVQVVATASLGAVIAGGGLGRFIIDGIARRDHPEVFVGAVLVVLLSLGTEATFTAFERLAVSPGLRGITRPVT